ncbi:MAG: hypothetical protein M5R40_07790 [Anaerolineae bacterium]|nr:hypothetical protein [Anaerolineae bacterium]
MQILWIEARPIQTPHVAPARPPIEVVDCRHAPDPQAALTRLQAAGDLEVWAETVHGEATGGRPRHELQPAPVLAIYTAPPFYDVLRAAVARVAPERVYLFAVDPGMDRPQAFLRRLAGLVHHIVRAKAGRASLTELAAATAQRERAVRKGLAWLAARGDIAVLGEQDGVVELARGGTPGAPDELRACGLQLRALLDETASYRDYVAHVDKDALISD